MIYIPTAGRIDRQLTADLLFDAGIPFVLVVDPGEIHSEYPFIVGPIGICAKRSWILSLSPHGKVIMMDDDLQLYARTPGSTSFPRADRDAVRRLTCNLAWMLDIYAHGGVCEKFMSNCRPTGYQINKRYFHILAYNQAMFPEPRPTYRVEGSEDLDMALQLLKTGRESFLLTDYAHADKMWSKGGCNLWRTPQLTDQMFCKLRDLHPDVVQAIPLAEPDKLGVTVKMRINWKKAAEIGRGL